MLTLRLTMPSRVTTRLPAGSSMAGRRSSGVLVSTALGGGSTGAGGVLDGGATGGATATAVGGATGSGTIGAGGGVGGGAVCTVGAALGGSTRAIAFSVSLVNKWAATKPYASFGASTLVHSPL